MMLLHLQRCEFSMAVFTIMKLKLQGNIGLIVGFALLKVDMREELYAAYDASCFLDTDNGMWFGLKLTFTLW